MENLKNEIPDESELDQGALNLWDQFDPEYAYFHKNETLDEKPFKSPFDISERLALLKRIADRADAPSFAVSVEEIAEILLDLGTIVKTLNGSGKLNPDIHEDPLDRSDDRGNIRMIHKPLFRPPQDFYEALGENIQQFGHQVLATSRKQLYRLADEDFVAQHLEYWDDHEATDLLAARKRVAILRNDNSLLVSRNFYLYGKLIDQKEKLERKIGRLQDQLDLETNLKRIMLNQFAFNITIPVISVNSYPSRNCTSDEDGETSIQTRNLEDVSKSESQLKSIQW